MQRGKGKRKTKQGKEIDGRLINNELIQLRQLQFILDTSKDIDKYKLNEIWSCYHKLQQLERDKLNDSDAKEWQNKLTAAIKKSELPNPLKQGLDTTTGRFKEESFGYFINQYYQARKRARSGRYFIYQSKKNKWITDGTLLTICTHKPRQKKHQWHIDLSGVLGVNSNTLKGKIDGENEDEKPEDYLPADYFKEIKGFKKTCKEVATAQKDYRGSLKIKIDFAQKKANEIKGTKKRLTGENEKLFNLAAKCEDLSNKLAEKLWPDLSKDGQASKAEKFNSVFSFAQIHNIVFENRSGFSKTCPVCSVDNGFRMQIAKDDVAQASRLPAMSVHLIDGVVMRICDAISRQVANTCWSRIQADLEQKNNVSIPLIMEQNRFEFEPSLREIKGGKQNKTRDTAKKENENIDTQYIRKG